MDIQVAGDVDAELLEADLLAAFGDPVRVDVIDDEGDLRLAGAPNVSDVDLLRQVLKSYRKVEQRDLDLLVVKARAVWNGTDTFTVAQVQKILAGLVLLENRRR